MKFYIETERLILRDLLPEDEEGMFELDSNKEVHRYLRNGSEGASNASEELRNCPEGVSNASETLYKSSEGVNNASEALCKGLEDLRNGPEGVSNTSISVSKC
jgi:hypothetical protein